MPIQFVISYQKTSKSDLVLLILITYTEPVSESRNRSKEQGAGADSWEPEADEKRDWISNTVQNIKK